MPIVPFTVLLIVTSSELVGTSPFDQFFPSLQLRLLSAPVQDTFEGVIRSSSPSKVSSTLVCRRFRETLARGSFRAATQFLIHWRQDKGDIWISSELNRLGVGDKEITLSLSKRPPGPSCSRLGSSLPVDQEVRNRGETFRKN